MKRHDTHKFIRLSTTLRAHSELAAAKAQQSYGEWIRQAITEKLKREMNGKRRLAMAASPRNS